MISDTTMRYATKLLNNHKDLSQTTTVIGVIISIDELRYTAEVYIPQSNTNLYNVQIGTSILGADAGVDVLPSVDQKCIVCLSSVHYPVIIALIPNQRQETKSLLLSGEVKIGSSEAYMKLSKDKTIGFRTGKGAISIDGEAIELISLSKREITPYVEEEKGFGPSNAGYSRCAIKEGPVVSAFIPKDNIIAGGAINADIKSKILADSDTMIVGLQDMVNEVSIFNETKSMFSDTILDELEGLRKSLNDRFATNENISLIMEHGDTEYNANNDATMSIRGYNNGEVSCSLAFKKDGTISIDCNDIIINKTGGNKDA